MTVAAVSCRKKGDKNKRAMLYLIEYLLPFILSVDSKMNPTRNIIFTAQHYDTIGKKKMTTEIHIPE